MIDAPDRPDFAAIRREWDAMEARIVAHAQRHGYGAWFDSHVRMIRRALQRFTLRSVIDVAISNAMQIKFWDGDPED